MFKIKRFGFTLAEVLITILIIGIIAVLILPSINKTISAKSRMTMLENVVANIGNTVEKDMHRTREEDITLTNIYNSPAAFLEEFDQAAAGEPFASSYKSISGSSVKVSIPADNSAAEAKARLKNGAGIGIINKLFDKDSTGVIIDVNGEDKPNIVGVDYFILEVAWDEDANNNRHPGDIGGYPNGGKSDTDDNETKENLRTACKTGSGAACYRLVELSGFKPDYIK